MTITFAEHLNHVEQQAAHDKLLKALENRMSHQFMQHRNRLKPKHITDILLDIESQPPIWRHIGDDPVLAAEAEEKFIVRV